MLLQFLARLLPTSITIRVFVLYCGRSSWCSSIPCVVMDRRCGVSLRGSALRDAYTHVLGLRFARVILASRLRQRPPSSPLTLRRPWCQLLRQRQSCPFWTLRRPWSQLLRQRQSCLLYSHIRPTIRCRTIATRDQWFFRASSAVASSFGDHSFSSISSCRHSSVRKWRLALSSTNCSRREVVQEVPLGRRVA